MHGFEGKYDGVAKRYQCVAELIADMSPTWNRGSGGSLQNRDRFSKYVGTRGVTTTEVGHRVCRPGPLPSLCRLGLVRRLDQGESMIDCHQQLIARQGLTV